MRCLAVAMAVCTLFYADAMIPRHMKEKIREHVCPEIDQSKKEWHRRKVESDHNLYAYVQRYLQYRNAYVQRLQYQREEMDPYTRAFTEGEYRQEGDIIYLDDRDESEDESKDDKKHDPDWMPSNKSSSRN